MNLLKSLKKLTGSNIVLCIAAVALLMAICNYSNNKGTLLDGMEDLESESSGFVKIGLSFLMITFYKVEETLVSNIELKNIEDSFASAANYINKIGWKKNQPCFYKIDLKENIPIKFLNTSIGCLVQP